MNQAVEHHACLCLGSNIDPQKNLQHAITLLREYTRIAAVSTCWETEAVGSSGPNFLNIGVCVLTQRDAAELKEQVLSPIERKLGRVRSADKNAPRTIDLDITLFDGQMHDPDLWKRVYLALIFSELHPDLTNPETGETVRETAARLQKSSLAIAHEEIVFS